MSDQNPTKQVGRPGHRRLAGHILDAMDQAESQGRTEIAVQLHRAHQMLIEQETIQDAHRRGVDSEPGENFPR